MISIKDRIGSEQMKSSGKKKQVKQTNKKQATFQGQSSTTYNQGSYFNPYATDISAQSRTHSTYKSQADIKKSVSNKKKSNISTIKGKKTAKVSELPRQRVEKTQPQQATYSNPYRNPYETSSERPHNLGQGSTKSREAMQETNSPQIRREKLRKSNKLTRAQLQKIKKKRRRQFVLHIVMVMLITTCGV